MGKSHRVFIFSRKNDRTTNLYTSGIEAGNLQPHPLILFKPSTETDTTIDEYKDSEDDHSIS